MSQATVKTQSDGTDNKIKGPSSGYRYVYADELIKNPEFRKKVTDKMGDWDITMVIDGFVDGPGYGGFATNDGGMRFTSGYAWLVSEGYPVQMPLPAGTRCPEGMGSEAINAAF